MLIDRQVDTYIEEKILPQQHIRRLANGSIDYKFYDQRAREGRGIAARAGYRSLAALIRHLASLKFNGRAARQAKTEQTQDQPRLSLVQPGRESTTSSQKTYSEAA